MTPPPGFDRWPYDAQDAWWEQELARIELEASWLERGVFASFLLALGWPFVLLLAALAGVGQ